MDGKRGKDEELFEWVGLVIWADKEQVVFGFGYRAGNERYERSGCEVKWEESAEGVG